MEMSECRELPDMPCFDLEPRAQRPTLSESTVFSQERIVCLHKQTHPGTLVTRRTLLTAATVRSPEPSYAPPSRDWLTRLQQAANLRDNIPFCVVVDHSKIFALPWTANDWKKICEACIKLPPTPSHSETSQADAMKEAEVDREIFAHMMGGRSLMRAVFQSPDLWSDQRLLEHWRKVCGIWLRALLTLDSSSPICPTTPRVGCRGPHIQYVTVGVYEDILPVVLRSPSSTPTSHPCKHNGNHSSHGQGCAIPTSSLLAPESAGCQSTHALSILRSNSQWGQYTRPTHGKRRSQWGSGMCHGSLTACRVLPPAEQ